MLFNSVFLALASVFVRHVSAHGGITSYVINGKPYPGWVPTEAAAGQHGIAVPYSTYDPVLNTADPNLACNWYKGDPAERQFSARVRYGSVITAQWSYQSHPAGPALVYMAKCPGRCASATSSELDWFKIAETGLISGTLSNGTWAAGIIRDSLEYNATIPDGLVHGNYLIRHEFIALHIPGSPQFYPNCAQLTVVGKGRAYPSAKYLTKFPGAYTLEDAGLTVDIYSEEAPTITDYKVPGPAVWTGQRD